MSHKTQRSKVNDLHYNWLNPYCVYEIGQYLYIKIIINTGIKLLRPITCYMHSVESLRRQTDLTYYAPFTYSKVVEFVHPEILEKLIDLSIPESVTPDDRLLELCRETIRYSVKTGKILPTRSG